MERETTSIRRADAPPLAVDISTGTFSMAGSQSPPGHQTLAIANIAAGWIVITTRRRQGRRCVTGSVDRLNRGTSLRSDRLGEFDERRGDSQLGHGVESEFVVAAVKVLQEGVPGDDHLRGPIGL